MINIPTIKYKFFIIILSLAQHTNFLSNFPLPQIHQFLPYANQNNPYLLYDNTAPNNNSSLAFNNQFTMIPSLIAPTINNISPNTVPSYSDNNTSQFTPSHSIAPIPPVKNSYMMPMPPNLPSPQNNFMLPPSLPIIPFQQSSYSPSNNFYRENTSHNNYTVTMSQPQQNITNSIPVQNSQNNILENNNQPLVNQPPLTVAAPQNTKPTSAQLNVIAQQRAQALLNDPAQKAKIAEAVKEFMATHKATIQAEAKAKAQAYIKAHPEIIKEKVAEALKRKNSIQALEATSNILQAVSGPDIQGAVTTGVLSSMSKGEQIYDEGKNMANDFNSGNSAKGLVDVGQIGLNAAGDTYNVAGDMENTLDNSGEKSVNALHNAAGNIDNLSNNLLGQGISTAKGNSTADQAENVGIKTFNGVSSVANDLIDGVANYYSTVYSTEAKAAVLDPLKGIANSAEDTGAAFKDLAKGNIGGVVKDTANALIVDPAKAIGNTVKDVGVGMYKAAKSVIHTAKKVFEFWKW